MRSGLVGFLRIIVWELLSSCRRDASQFGEVELIKQLLPEERGFYVDIGSGRPISGSNTYNLYKRGWSGILVDPIPINSFLSKLLRRRDNFHLGLVGDSLIHNFFLFEPYAYSTTDHERASQVLKSKGDSVRLLETLRLQSVTLKDLCINYNVSNIDFLSLDVEGVELNVLRSNDWLRFVPRVICVEILNPGATAVISYLEELGYELYGTAGPSYIFIQVKSGGGGI